MIWEIYIIGVAFILGAVTGSGGFYIFLKASTFTQIDNRLEIYELQERVAEIHEMQQRLAEIYEMQERVAELELAYEAEQTGQPLVR